jgi:hypothetical protein
MKKGETLVSTVQVGKLLTWKEKDRLPDKQIKRQSLTSRFYI